MTCHFNWRANLTFERMCFTRRIETSEELISQYVAELRALAAECELPVAQLEERIAISLSSGWRMPKPGTFFTRG